MSRYHWSFQSATAIAVDTQFADLMCPAGSGFTLRRVTASLVTVGSAGAPPDQNCCLGIAPSLAAGVGAVTGPTAASLLMNQNSPAALAIPATSFATTQPTFGATATDPFQISCSSRGGGDLFWEGVEEWQVLKGVTNGLVFVNRINALTTPLAWKIDVEWEE